ncbi:MAG: hypothetical protein GF344_18870 [Chitinivibrionales bacterium]|nr:hypothetical protein [Chitinivibrionales bacterium]
MRLLLNFQSLAILVCIVKIAAPNDIHSGMDGILHTMNAHTRKEGRLGFGFAFKGDFDGYFVASDSGRATVVNENGEKLDAGVQRMYSMVGHINYVIMPFAAVGIALPFYADATGWGERSYGLGDLQFTFAMTFPFQKPDAVIDYGFGFGYIVPTGKQNHGYFLRHVYHTEGNHLNHDDVDPGDNFYSIERLSLFVRTMFTVHFDRSRLSWPLTLNFNINSRVVTEENRDNAEIGGLGLVYHGFETFEPFAEISWEFRDSYRWAQSIDLKKFRYDPVKLGLGANVKVSRCLSTFFSLNCSLSKDIDESRTHWDNNDYRYSTAPIPAVGIAIGMNWQGLGPVPQELPFGSKKKEDNNE